MTREEEDFHYGRDTKEETASLRRLDLDQGECLEDRPARWPGERWPSGEHGPRAPGTAKRPASKQRSLGLTPLPHTDPQLLRAVPAG